ncbi:MAG: PilZ domain-containing protein [Candidatus Omnitrophota bacterium]
MEFGKEKREHPRWDCRVPIMCRRGTVFDNAQTMDISNTGVGFLSSRFVPVNTSLILEIALSPKSEPIMALGRVCWVQKCRHSDNYRLGMNFTDVSEDSKRRLTDYFARETI